MGGEAIVKKYGKPYFKELVRRRWDIYRAKADASAEGCSTKKASARSAKK